MIGGEETIRNNNYDYDEITMSGFAVETAKTVKAPRIKECFLNLECGLLWEKEHFEGSRDTTVCLRVKRTAMNGDYCDEEKRGDMVKVDIFITSILQETLIQAKFIQRVLVQLKNIH